MIVALNSSKRPGTEDSAVLRGEPFSLEHLEAHARHLANCLVLAKEPAYDRKFAARFEQNAEVLRSAYEETAKAIRSSEPLTSDAEWLLDNFYVVEEQLHEIRVDLPPRFYRELPKLVTGLPRVYALALELIVHTDSALDEETIVRCVRAFQTVTPLSIGEIWAVPIMLRLGLVENLRRLAVQMVATRRCRTEAKRLLTAWREPEAFPLDLAATDRCFPVVLQLLEQLKEQSGTASPAWKRLEQQLTDYELTPHDIAQREHQRQAADQVSIGNVITSMRMISALDWVVFFERTNQVEQILQQDPAEIYPHLDFESRNRYRGVVEDLAKRSASTDVHVAQVVLDHTGQASVHDKRAFGGHVGYWLVGDGRPKLEAELRYRPPLQERARRWMLRHPHGTYFGSIGGATVLALLALLVALQSVGVPWSMSALLCVLALLPASELAVCLTNLFITRNIPPRLLPKLEFKEGIPTAYSSFVVVPSMLTSPREVQALLNRLESHYLANSDPSLRFALLTDLADADEQHKPGDDELVAQAVTGIRALNTSYATVRGGPFFLLHRERRWNPSDELWMGWERKRGKLMEFNRWLHGATDTSYIVQEGDLEWRTRTGGVKFVITLDADTQMPYGVAARLIGTLAHPLNRPQFDREKRRVTSGYALLQPRISIHLGSANRTLFARIFANRPGLDPYTTAASDVYQDLFGEGSFTGKGIYDLDAFEQAVANAFPENQILSHDLIEGCHARVGLVSDIELIDSFPARYDADARRQHRWVRGDWQILPWLFRRVSAANGYVSNPLTLLSRWKIFDNLRRSLVYPAAMLFLLAGWLAFPAAAWIVTGAVVLTLALPALSPALLSLTRWPRGVEWSRHFRAVWGDLGKSLLQMLLIIAFLPHYAGLSLDAILRTLYRMWVGRRHLLEWETAAATERRLSQSRWSTFRQMWYVPAIAVGLALFLDPTARVAAAPFLIAWLVAPVIAHWVSLPIRVRESGLSATQRKWLRQTARKTWTFFETYVTPECHWLPPDNLQEYPAEKLAHRVSPTNEGLFLVSALVARDFGYLGLSGLADWLEQNLDSWMKFDRLRGHFYNWYDTLTLKPLLPRYVSTVDSGNLFACLLTMRQGIAELRSSPIVTDEHWLGLDDTIAVAEEACENLHPRGARFVSRPLNDLTDGIAALRNHAQNPPDDPLAWCVRLALLRRESVLLLTRLQAFQVSGEFPKVDVVPKVHSLVHWITSLDDEVRALFSWTAAIAKWHDDAVLPEGEALRVGEAPAEPLERRRDGATERRRDIGSAVVLSVPPSLHSSVSPSKIPVGHSLALPWSASQGCVEAWNQLWQSLVDCRTLAAIQVLEQTTADQRADLRSRFSADLVASDRDLALAWLDELADAIRSSAAAAKVLDGRLEGLARRMEALALNMDFRFLFNSQRRLFAIGFNLEDGKLDRAHYDILCSEARLASYLAIVKGDVEPRHWFQLGRPMTQTDGQAALLSWGGTMFEYLMPPLFQRDYDGSLLSRSCRAAVARQRQYGRQHGVPWGISESAFSALAANADYQYKSFGVPGLGLKRGLAKDLVVSPYSTAMALEIDPSAACENLEALAREGALGPWGFYDSIDYTPQRMPAGKRSLVTRCYMTHHQGMSLLAMANLFHAGCIRRRFNAHPLPRSGELLLQERMPSVAPRVEPHADEVAAVEVPRADDDLVSRRLTGTDTSAPRTHLLANDQYSVMVTNSGSGYSHWRDLAVSRWRPDTTRDGYGQFIYLRDMRSRRVWSATYQPTCVQPDAYEVVYSIDKAEFHRRDGDIETHLEIAVSPENNAEVRSLRITNHGTQTRQIEITTYLEVVLNSQAADVAHPAFQKLFIETEYVRDETALLARRRPRDSHQQPVWAVHVLAGGSIVGDTIQYETNRQTFLGRGRTLERPAALDPYVRLSDQVGAVLDPILSLRCTVTIRPHESTTIGLTTALANSHEEALILADQYHDIRGVQRAFELAWAFHQVQLRHLQLSPAKAHLYQRLAAAILYPDPAYRGAADLMHSNRSGQRGLWRYGISGDLPILLAHVTKPDHVSLVRELLVAQAYWRSHGLAVDVVILNDYPGSYIDALNEQLLALLSESERVPGDRNGAAFLLRGSHMLAEDKALCEIAASVVLYGDRGSIGQQWELGARASRAANRPRRATASISTQRSQTSDWTSSTNLNPDRPKLLPAGATAFTSRQNQARDLEFWNGMGGFALDGREYRILLTAAVNTPLPWSNVIANPSFGTVITETGGGYTWFGNSRENKLTTWCNDPVSDPPAEALYIKDDKTGELWSPMPGILRDAGDYWIHHGQGYTRFQHTASGIEHDLLVSIAPEDSVKFLRLKLRNTGQHVRQFALTFYVEWVLGVCREQTQLYLQTEIDAATGALLARNSFHPDFPEQVAFLHTIDGNWSYTGDRTEFLGRCGDVRRPQAIQDLQLSGRVGLGLDPCGAVQTKLRLAAGAETEVIFLLGAGKDSAAANQLLARYKDPEAVRQACDQTVAKWNQLLEVVHVRTPNRAFDLLVNRWLLYQTVSCRFWGRSAFYQSGGAYGFRDQLQDVMALVYSRPDLVREHLLRAASRQYEEGDVQHWWHPPEGRGTRTRFSDDFLWLALTTCHYVRTTGDSRVLDEEAPFLHSLPLEAHEQERYETPTVSANRASLYEHCRRAIEHGLRLGPHGLPLMGCGDWNDGMNRVGEQGIGESIWVGWFQLVILREFIPLMKARGDDETARDYQTYADTLREALEQHAWDGQWYRRAYFDDGTPLGSVQNDECQIDSIAQTWSVFADANPSRVRQAVQAVLERLVRWNDRLVLLLAPPFDQTKLDPGYIKGYLPGIRENGGQYTHPALWLIQSLAELGSVEEAMSIFDLINPIHHAATFDDASRYRVEPYVVAADVYGVLPHVGRGGWTWYTGSAAWMYRVALETLLGFELIGDRVRWNPQLPGSWPGFELTFRRGRSTWKFIVDQSQAGQSAVDGESRNFELVDDGESHEIHIHLPRRRVD